MIAANVAVIAVSAFLLFQGLTLMGYGWIVSRSIGSFKLDIASNSLTISIWAGLFMILVGILGVVGGAMGKRMCVLVFCILSGVIVLCKIALVVSLYYFNDKKHVLIKRGMQEVIRYYMNIEEFTKAIDKVQQRFKCCGISGPSDWINHQYLAGRNDTPDSCCKIVKEGCGKDMAAAPSEDVIYTLNCTSSYFKYVGANVTGMAAFLIVMFTLMGFEIVVAASARKKF